MSDTATDMFDNHELWEELSCVDEWLVQLSDTFDPSYAGLPDLASDFIRRIELVIGVTKLYLGSVPKEIVSQPLLDELKTSVASIQVEVSTIKWDNEVDYDEVLDKANTAAQDLLATLQKLGFKPAQFLEQKQQADASERHRFVEFLNKSRGIVSEMERKSESLSDRISENKHAAEENLNELRSQIEEVAERFEEEIDDGVEAGKKRIDDQITTLQSQYNSEIEKQKLRAREELDTILNQIKMRKTELDALMEEAQAVSGYVAEAAMSRMFKGRAQEAKALWLSFTGAATIVTLISATFLYFAGLSALEDTATSGDVIRGILRAIIGAGAGVLATYLFHQASIQQRSFQDSRSAEARLGSLEAFLAPFEFEDAMDIRRGVGQRVYIDGELGEVARESQSSSTRKGATTQQGSEIKKDSIDVEKRSDTDLES